MYGLQYNTAQGAFLGWLPRGRHDQDRQVSRRTAACPSRPSRSTWTGSGRACSTTTRRTRRPSRSSAGTRRSRRPARSGATAFTDQNKGKQITQAFIGQGADIIFPVAGGTGLGSAAAAKASNGKDTVHLGRHRRLRQRSEVLLGVPDQRHEGPHQLGHEVRPRGGWWRQAGWHQLHRDAGERRDRSCAVPRLRQQGACAPSRPSSQRSPRGSSRQPSRSRRRASRSSRRRGHS